MIRKREFLFILISVLLLFETPGLCQGNDKINGKWIIIPEKSSGIGLYRTLSLDIQHDGSLINIIQTWGPNNRKFVDTITVRTDGEINKLRVNNRVFPTNVFMGLSMEEGEERTIRAEWEGDGNILKMDYSYNVFSSQGKFPVTGLHTYELDEKEEILTYTINRSSRDTNNRIKYLLKKEGSRNAYYMFLENDWNIDGLLPEQAFLISLQALANSDEPKLYFVYPDEWDFRFTPDVLRYLATERYYSFSHLPGYEKALETFSDKVSGYVVWDKNVRTSLIVSFTVAGLENAVVVSEEMIPYMEEYGLKKLEDFRGKFPGWSDYEIYNWAYEQYWYRCSKEYIVWMGGEHGNVMKPGVADWGIYKKAFFNDLSTKEEDTLEYQLAEKLFSEMQPLSFVFGWHSYKKDKERDHVKLASRYALRVEGLHTLPNMSFSSQIPLSPGFEFKNNHNIIPEKEYDPENKIYIACIQTDCLGLGAWNQPGRGSIPYAWEVTMNWSWLAPAMMEYFYSLATPKDYFIGSLSGPGYMYPKAIPEEYLPRVINIAYELMKKLDLNVFEIMDYSEGATVEGNTELTREVVEAYYEGMPDVLGFVNGYAPAYTFYTKNGKPFISYDYYLSPERTEKEVVADLNELSNINTGRPYFLLMHVRQWSNIIRVKTILDKLGPEFEIIPLDVFMKMAGREPTFKERFLRK